MAVEYRVTFSQGERQEMTYQPIVEQLSQLLMNDWDNRSTLVNRLLPLA